MGNQVPSSKPACLGGSGTSSNKKKKKVRRKKSQALAASFVQSADYPTFDEMEEYVISENEPLPEVSSIELQGVDLDFVEHLLEEYEIKAANMTTEKVVSSVILQVTQSRKCQVNQIVKPEYRGPISHFVSHAWGNMFSRTMSAVLADAREWETSNKKKAYIWMDIFCLNQHRMTEGDYSQPEILGCLMKAVEASELTVAVLDPWNKPLYVSRCWCLYEVYARIKCEEQRLAKDEDKVTKLQTKGRVKVARKNNRALKFILGPEAQKEFAEEGLSGSEFDAILSVLIGIDINKANASKAEDKKMILDSIESSYTCGQLNENIKLSLRTWLVSSGQKIVKQKRKVMGGGIDPSFAKMLVNLGRLLADQAETYKEKREVLNLFEQAYSVDSAVLSLSSQSGNAKEIEAGKLNIARDLTLLGSCFYSMGNFEKALEKYQDSHLKYKDIGNDELIAQVLTRMGPTYMKLQDWENSIGSLRTAIEIFEREKILTSDFAETLSLLAYILDKCPESEKYEEEIENTRDRVLKIRLKCQGPDHPDVAMALAQIGRQKNKKKKHKEASRHYKQATEILSKLYGEDHEKTRRMRQRLMGENLLIEMNHEEKLFLPK